MPRPSSRLQAAFYTRATADSFKEVKNLHQNKGTNRLPLVSIPPVYLASIGLRAI
jgi:hypothetical protein